MNAFRTWIQNIVNQARNSWINRNITVEDIIYGVIDILDRIFANATRLMVIGFIINIVTAHFYPEFAERFPVLYGWFDGWLQLGEFAVKAAFGTIYAIFTGTWNEFYANYNVAFQEMWSQFVNWLNHITF